MKINDYTEDTQVLITDSLNITRTFLQELNTMYESASEDWNSTNRNDIGLKIAKVTKTLLILENLFLLDESEEE
jgi:hypothetical protein